MTTFASPTTVPRAPEFLPSTLALAERNILRIRRNSGSVISATVIPGLFLVALYIVFSRVMESNGIDYGQYLVPAATHQAVLFTAGGSAMAIGVDKANGINDRLRASPVSTAAPVLGRLVADLTRAVLSVTVVTVIAAVFLGFRWKGDAGDTLVYLTATVGFAVAASLVYDGISLLAATPESAAALLQAVSMPLIMLSTSFVPAETLPDGAADIIGALPVSVIGELLRQASTTGVTAGTAGAATAWIVGLAVVGAVLCARSFRRSR